MVYFKNERRAWATVEKSARVLLAGIGASDRRAVAALLDRHGCAVDAFSDPDAAVQQAAARVPDLVVLLPDVTAGSGRELSRRLRADERTEQVPVLLMCDRDTRIDWLQGIPGDFDLIRRPFHDEDLVVRVRLLLRVRRLSGDIEALQNQFRTAQKLQCVGALTAGMAHEFNNLMCAVMGFAEMARDEGGTDLEALRESADISYDTAKRAAATAASLLAFSRGGHEERAPGDLNDAVAGAVRLLRKYLEKNGIRVDFEPGKLPVTEFAAGPMQQVFLNLIINAWHAMLESQAARELRISTRCERGSKIVATVRDTGKGIPLDEQEKIFEPFYTTKNGADSPVSGSGLGLPLVRNVVESHGGTVHVDSAPGKGACFTVMLPVRGRKEAEPPDAAGAPGLGGHSVLIVDDEEGSRRVLSRLLLKRGHDACAVGSMSEALHCLESRGFDIIVMDMIMPESDGTTNIRLLRDRGITVPILICTGQMDEASVRRGLSAGASDVIHKPFSADEFVAVMQRCLAGGELAMV